jgi:hypothetical protein
MTFDEKMNMMESLAEQCDKLDSMVAAATMCEFSRIAMRGFAERECDYWIVRLSDLLASHVV